MGAGEDGPAGHAEGRPARTIVLASGNPAKRDQLRWLLRGLPLEPLERAMPVVAETASTQTGNAAAKALAASSHGLAVASDGGLEVPALGDAWQPLLTRRQGQARLRELAAGLTDRRVRWREAVALAERGRLLASWEEAGTQGLLLPEPWPEPPGDFWAWEIIVLPGLGKTWAQANPDERQRWDLTWTRLKAHVQAFLGPLLLSP